METRMRSSGAFDRVTCGESAYTAVSLLLDERLRTAEDARVAGTHGGAGLRLRSRAGRVLVAFGTWIGGHGPERSVPEALPAPARPHPARAGRAG